MHWFGKKNRAAIHSNVLSQFYYCPFHCFSMWLSNFSDTQYIDFSDIQCLGLTYFYCSKNIITSKLSIYLPILSFCGRWRCFCTNFGTAFEVFRIYLSALDPQYAVRPGRTRCRLHSRDEEWWRSRQGVLRVPQLLNNRFCRSGLS